MRMMISIGLILFFLESAGAESAVFDYEDFGPQVLAYETIGYQWYQWNAIGDCDPGKIDAIRVVVYWNEPIASIKAKYPVRKKHKKDFRYLEFEAAMAYLDSTISEFKDARRLIMTREKLLYLKK